MTAEIAKLDSTIKNVEAQRSVDYKALSDSIDGVRNTLPTTSTIWKAAGATVGGLIAAAALAWAIFDTGSSITGAFADEIIGSREASKKAADANVLLNQKLDRLISNQGGKQVVGNDTMLNAQ